MLHKSWPLCTREGKLQLLGLSSLWYFFPAKDIHLLSFLYLLCGSLETTKHPSLVVVLVGFPPLSLTMIRLE